VVRGHRPSADRLPRQRTRRGRSCWKACIGSGCRASRTNHKSAANARPVSVDARRRLRDTEIRELGRQWYHRATILFHGRSSGRALAILRHLLQEVAALRGPAGDRPGMHLTRCPRVLGDVVTMTDRPPTQP
jgi:hypothetical protein